MHLHSVYSLSASVLPCYICETHCYCWVCQEVISFCFEGVSIVWQALCVYSCLYRWTVRLLLVWDYFESSYDYAYRVWLILVLSISLEIENPLVSPCGQRYSEVTGPQWLAVCFHLKTSLLGANLPYNLGCEGDSTWKMNTYANQESPQVFHKCVLSP